MSDEYLEQDQPRRKNPVGVRTVDRLPPNSPEAEFGVLACVMLDPTQSMPLCIQALADKEQFYDLRAQTIYEAFIELWEDGKPIDTISVSENLKTWNKLEDVGGIVAISNLPDAVPSAANLEYYLEIVREKAALRGFIRTATDAISTIYSSEEDTDTILDRCERDILKAGEARLRRDSQSMRQLVAGSLQRFTDYYQNPGAITGIQSGFPDLDFMTGGFKPGDMIVIAGRPSMGKTSLCMNIAESVAVSQRIPVGVFSLEMTAEALTDRMVSCRARVNIRDIQRGQIGDMMFPRISNAARAIAAAPLYIDDESGLSILRLRAKARRMFQLYGVKLIVVDYLQLLNALGGKRRFENRQQEVSDISNGLKGLAKELKIPVIIAAQLNRTIEREKRKPVLSDLRESGSIEQDADLVGLLYKVTSQDEDEPPEPENETAIPVNLLIAKQRNGGTGDVNLTFLKPYTRFESVARVSPSDPDEEDIRDWTRRQREPELPMPPNDPEPPADQ